MSVNQQNFIPVNQNVTRDFRVHTTLWELFGVEKSIVGVQKSNAGIKIRIYIISPVICHGYEVRTYDVTYGVIR